jgi:hypothetical protein
MQFEALPLGAQLELDGRTFSALPVNHVVPACGLRVSNASGSLAFSGDTTSSEALVEALNAIPDLRHLIIETSFENELVEIAKETAAVNRDDFGQMGFRLLAATQNLGEATEFLTRALAENRLTQALAGATPYLRLFGLTTGGALLAKGAPASGTASGAAPHGGTVRRRGRAPGTASTPRAICSAISRTWPWRL